jgi:MFS family permease
MCSSVRSSWTTDVRVTDATSPQERPENTSTPGTFRSLRHQSARLFFFGLFVSMVGTWLQFTATSFLLYDLTGRATDMGLNAMFQFLPMLFLGAWAGGFADRHDRRIVTLCTQASLAVLALVLGVLDLTGLVTLPVIYAMSFLLGITNAIDNPARRGLVTELVPPEDISNVISLNTAVMTGSRIFGPALAAVLVAPLGTGWLFIVNGLSFAAILVALTRLSPQSLYQTPQAKPGGQPVRDALRHVRDHGQLLVLFTVFTVVCTFAYNYAVVLPKLLDEKWNATRSFGWMLAVISAGSFLGSLSIARLREVTSRWFFLAIVCAGIGNIALAWSPNLVAAYVWSVPLGWSLGAMVSSMNSLMQVGLPSEMRSRMLALTAVAFLGSTPIGGPITGWIADNVSNEWAMGYGGVVSLVCGFAYFTVRSAERSSKAG